jgi:RNA polymerase sigma-70 factor, ECF subfamily
VTQHHQHEVDEVVARLAREESGRVVALLARRFNDLDLADDAVQDALIEAVSVWAERGIPDNQAGWLLSVARRKAIDRLRRLSSARRRTMQAANELLAQTESDDAERSPMIDDANAPTMGDEHLRLVLLCCHPALDRDTQVALTLRLVGGLSTPEIAAAFLVPEATLAQRIVRAKRKIRDAGMPLSIPSNLDERVDTVLSVLYLIFNEGYLTRGDRDGVVRLDLVDEAVRLTSVLNDLLPACAEVEGLLALEMFNVARMATRTDQAGDLVLLDRQDRTRWDLATIERANSLLTVAMSRMTPGPFQIQALIARSHANARTAADTDWPMIATLYGQLVRMTESAVVKLNHAVAVAMADGPNAGLALVNSLKGLDEYHLFHATRGELLMRADDHVAAAEAFARARILATNPAEQRHLDRRLGEVGDITDRS